MFVLIQALAVSNSGPEAAMEWIFGHLEDVDLNDPLPVPVSAGAPAAAPSLAIGMLIYAVVFVLVLLCTHTIMRAVVFSFSTLVMVRLCRSRVSSNAHLNGFFGCTRTTSIERNWCVFFV